MEALTMSNELTDAAWDGDLDTVHRLISGGADPNEPDDDGTLPVTCAAIGSVACFDALVAAGARLDATILAHCLNWSCAAGRMELVERLLGLGADVEAQPYCAPALHAAASLGRFAIVNRILAAGARVDSQDRRGRTPTHEAAMGRYIPVLERLVEAGADIHAKDNDGATPLDLVVRRESIVYPDESPVSQSEVETIAWLRAAMAVKGQPIDLAAHHKRKR
jgi:ankyrin repeat protein